MNRFRGMSIVFMVFVFCLFATGAFADDAEWITSGLDIYNANSGMVGIGTAAPEQQLHINGSYPWLLITGEQNGFLGLRAYSAAPYHSNIFFDNRGDLCIASQPYANRGTGSNEVSRLTINGSNGNVGIGTTAPNAKLEINAAPSTVGLKVEGSQGGIGIEGLVFINNTEDANTLKVKSTATNATDRYLADFSNANGSVMRINGGGNVGIGTTNPQSKLAVNGTITAKEVKVTTTGWSDFVFEDSYKLPSLDHVESYIKENKHLPDVPSAKQISEDGLSMAEMMAKQMQKIEELTLYVIELKKENESLKERMAAIEKK